MHTGGALLASSNLVDLVSGQRGDCGYGVLAGVGPHWWAGPEDRAVRPAASKLPELEMGGPAGKVLRQQPVGLQPVELQQDAKRLLVVQLGSEGQGGRPVDADDALQQEGVDEGWSAVIGAADQARRNAVSSHTQAAYAREWVRFCAFRKEHELRGKGFVGLPTVTSGFRSGESGTCLLCCPGYFGQ